MLYELREAHFYEIRRLGSLNEPVPKAKEDRDPEIADGYTRDTDLVLNTGDDAGNEIMTRCKR